MFGKDEFGALPETRSDFEFCAENKVPNVGCARSEMSENIPVVVACHVEDESGEDSEGSLWVWKDGDVPLLIDVERVVESHVEFVGVAFADMYVKENASVLRRTRSKGLLRWIGKPDPTGEMLTPGVNHLRLGIRLVFHESWFHQRSWSNGRSDPSREVDRRGDVDPIRSEPSREVDPIRSDPSREVDPIR